MVGRLDGWLVGISVIISFRGGNLHIHASIGQLIFMLPKVSGSLDRDILTEIVNEEYNLFLGFE